MADPERNREILAERLGWPDGALAAVRDLEARYPGWRVHYDRGGLPNRPEPAFVAVREQREKPSQMPPTFAAPTPEALAELLDAYRPPWTPPPPWASKP